MVTRIQKTDRCYLFLLSQFEKSETAAKLFNKFSGSYSRMAAFYEDFGHISFYTSVYQNNFQMILKT